MATKPPSKKSARAHDPVRGAALEAILRIEADQQTDAAVRRVTAGKNFRPLDVRFLMQLVTGTTKKA
jgi:hypothetical protein